MNTTDIRERTTEELLTMEGDLQRQLWKARFDNHTNLLDNTSNIQALRRDVARVKTILTERRTAERAVHSRESDSTAQSRKSGKKK